jgi:hypothetical protein
LDIKERNIKEMKEKSLGNKETKERKKGYGMKEEIS